MPFSSSRTCGPGRDYDFVLTEADLAPSSHTSLSFISGGGSHQSHASWPMLPLAHLKQFERVTKSFQLSAEASVSEGEPKQLV